MSKKFTLFISLSLSSFSASACGGSGSSLVESLILIISMGLALLCIFLLPMSIILFNVKRPSIHTWCFIGYFIAALSIVVVMFYASNSSAYYLMLLLSIFCALPTIHTILLALSHRKYFKQKKSSV